MADSVRGAPGFLREGYRVSTRRWRVDGPPGAENFQTEHWDGRLDAEVRPRPVKMRVRRDDH